MVLAFQMGALCVAVVTAPCIILFPGLPINHQALFWVVFFSAWNSCSFCTVRLHLSLANFASS